ncbi:patched family-domain-containing protein [Haematococcus lacustris]
MGAMLLAGIQLNAVSLVNLAMALGIAVEFCAHVLHAFTTAPGSRPQRMAAALEKCGASVLSGITFTKLVGVAVLAAARTQIFRVYYFRLYLALVVLGALHGLVLLPILLALVGPPSQAQPAPLTALAPPSPVPYMHVGNVDILQPSGSGQPPGAQRTLR